MFVTKSSGSNINKFEISWILNVFSIRNTNDEIKTEKLKSKYQPICI